MIYRTRPPFDLQHLRAAALAIALLGVGAASAGAAAPAPSVTLSPLPGTPDASPDTQISFLGASAAQLSRISVHGSRSGRHAGHLRSYSTATGASFLPAKRFLRGETVTVTARVAGGTGPSRQVSSAFVIARPAPSNNPPSTLAPRAKPGSVQSFVSRPDLHPPTVVVDRTGPVSQSGDVFIAPDSGAGQWGPMIFEPSGNLVWFAPVGGGNKAMNLRVQQYAGKPVMTWWQGYISPFGVGQGVNEVYDGSYHRIAEVRAGNGYQADLHDFQLTPQGGALLTAYSPVRTDLNSVGGPRNGAVTDSVVQAVDIPTGLVMFEWHSLGHIGLDESYLLAQKNSDPYDYFHVNSVQPDSARSLLISARNTWAAYEIDAATGAVLWRLGGKKSSFRLGPGTRTAWQHDIERQADGTYTVFDNGAAPKTHPQSRAIQLSVDFRRRSVSLVRSYEHPARLLTGSQGNLQLLAGGDAFVGWGAVPHFSEFSAAGQLLFDAYVPAPGQSYRAYRFAWAGQPTEAPALSIQRSSTGVTARVSWNGATGVASWQLLAGPDPGSLGAVRSVARSGFETTIAAQTGQPYIAVRAYDASGAALGTSGVLKG